MRPSLHDAEDRPTAGRRAVWHKLTRMLPKIGLKGGGGPNAVSTNRGGNQQTGCANLSVSSMPAIFPEATNRDKLVIVEADD
jgi:hypothetical protein